MNQQSTRPKSAPVNNSVPKIRRNPESPGQAAKKQRFQVKKTQTNLHLNRKTN